MDDEVEKWIKHINARDLAGTFTDKTPGDKKTSEFCQLEFWIAAMKSSFGIETTSVQRPESDPPDFIVTQDGTEKSVEVTEFVNGDFLKKVAVERVRGQKYGSHHGIGFLESRWDRSKFLEHLSNLIEKKRRLYTSGNAKIHTLAIVIDEAWLNRDCVSQ